MFTKEAKEELKRGQRESRRLSNSCQQSAVETRLPYTHTHTESHTPTDQHTLLCVLSALCGLFLEKFSFMMSVRDRVIITEHTTQKLRRNVYKDVCECASVCVRLCVCVWRPYNNQHLSRLDALLN